MPTIHRNCAVLSVKIPALLFYVLKRWLQFFLSLKWLETAFMAEAIRNSWSLKSFLYKNKINRAVEVKSGGHCIVRVRGYFIVFWKAWAKLLRPWMPWTLAVVILPDFVWRWPLCVFVRAWPYFHGYHVEMQTEYKLASGPFSQITLFQIVYQIPSSPLIK